MEFLVLGSILLIAILAFCVAGIIQEELGVREIRAQLRAPLLHDDGADSIERRVEVAIRQARAGFRACTHCEFTNPIRASLCVVCGAVIAVATTKNKKKHRHRHTPTQHQEVHTVATSHTLSAIQIRIRRRKEWTRQVTSDGMVEWRHNPPSSTASNPLVDEISWLVLRKESPPPTNEESREQDPVLANELPSTDDVSTDTLVDDEITVVVADTLNITSAQVALALAQELTACPLTLIDAHDADPTQPAFSRGSATSNGSSVAQEIKDTVVSSGLDFPTKLAEFITSACAIFLDASTQQESQSQTVSRFNVNRQSLWTDSVDVLATMTQTQVRAAIRVDFMGEQGIDAGGVYREWFLLVNERMVHPDAGIFVCADYQDQSLFLNRHSKEVLGEHHLAHFFVAGRLIGRALLEGNATGFHLSLPLLKLILGLPVGFQDLEYFDPDAFKSLRWLLNNDGVDTLGLDFTVTEISPSDGSARVVELVPGGSQRDVTDANKLEFIERKVRYLLFEGVSSQLFAFLKGLYQVVPVELLMLFDAEELDYVLSGSDGIDVDDWERNTITAKNLVDHPALASFWSCTRALTNEQRQRLLQFATGATRVPPGGFSALTSYDGRQCRFTLRGIDPMRTRGYIHSHACFNRLDLPLHLDPRDMKKAMSAVLSSRSYGFTTA